MSSSSDTDLVIGMTDRIASKKTKSTKKKKKTGQATVIVPGHGENEGDRLHWAYEPPEGARLLDHSVDVGPFEWDAIEDDEDTEIWLIRVPDSIKPKYLNGLQIDPPSSSRTARVGGLKRKNASYDVWAIGDDDAELAGGEELRGLTCLLPRKRKEGKLFIAPKQVSRHLVISAQHSIATAPENQPIIYQDPPRPSYPKAMLKHTFIPYGARSVQTRSEELSMDVDDIQAAADKPADMASLSRDKPEKTKAKESKGKKRKGDGDSHKKSKKHKLHT